MSLLAVIYKEGERMETRIIREPNREELEELGAALRSGELVAIPTETVYGLGANGLDEEAIQGIYKAKGRPSDNPLILHIPNEDSMVPLVTHLPETAKKLIQAFWPGPLTITLPKSDLVPFTVTGGLPNVALRCPDHDLCRDILLEAGVPIAAPSANVSGRPSPTTADAVYHDMNGKIPYIVDAGPCTIGVESTVVEVGDDSVTILRPGGITADMLKRIVPTVMYDANLTTGKGVPKAPGMKYKHYAPDSPMKTFVGKNEAVSQAIYDSVVELTNGVDLDRNRQRISIGLLVGEEVAILLEGKLASLCDVKLIVYGDSKDYRGLAHRLYSSLLEFNDASVDYIFAQGVYPEGIGVAIMNRLEKASNKQVFNV